ncbi:MAG TPA: alpha/beta fold hydrolase [Blastocatellia bacterium]|nr:alpha/beta fold hydrolase [Blastocatellia bacterium]
MEANNANLTGNLFIPGPAGRLEAIFKSVDENDSRVAIVAHPHPVYGGTMHNKVVYRTAQALNQCGISTYRFNFRGVGLSDGSYDEGKGERDDLRAVIDYVIDKFPDRELIIGGFSFGAWVGLDVGCHDKRVSTLLGIGTPVRILEINDLSKCDKPKLFVQGTLDEYGPLSDIEQWYQGLSEPKQLVRIKDADHFFDGHLEELMTAIRDYFAN